MFGCRSTAVPSSTAVLIAARGGRGARATAVPVDREPSRCDAVCGKRLALTSRWVDLPRKWSALKARVGPTRFMPVLTAGSAPVVISPPGATPRAHRGGGGLVRRRQAGGGTPSWSRGGLDDPQTALIAGRVPVVWAVEVKNGTAALCASWPSSRVRGRRQLSILWRRTATSTTNLARVLRPMPRCR